MTCPDCAALREVANILVDTIHHQVLTAIATPPQKRRRRRPKSIRKVR